MSSRVARRAALAALVAFCATTIASTPGRAQSDGVSRSTITAAPPRAPNPLGDALPVAGIVRRHDRTFTAHDNASGQALEIGREALLFPGSTSVQVEFDRVRLPAGSAIELRSLVDGDREVITHRSLRGPIVHSAYFNGDSVLVRLIAGPGTRGTTAHIRSVATGIRGGLPGPASICGSTDDRVNSTDRRVSRLILRTGSTWTWCTGWLITSTNTLVSAGHCAKVSGLTHVTAEFNVPQSDSGGNFNHPPAADQYNWESLNWQANAGTPTIGDDWAVLRIHPNTTTLMHAGAVQGGYFAFVANPPTGRSTRVTGFGSASGTRNGTNKTHAGPLTAASSTTVSYQADTTGGNSGSPVIDTATDRAFGVHTNAGCTSTGGANQGTAAARADFAAARSRLSVAPGPCAARNTACTVPHTAGNGNVFAIVAITTHSIEITGFSLYTRTNVTANVAYGLHLADGSGRPAATAVRTGTAVIGATAGWYGVSFAPYPLPAGRRYFLVWADSRMMHPICNSAGSLTTPHYWRPPTSGTWNGPFDSVAWAYRVSCRTTPVPGAFTAYGNGCAGSGPGAYCFTTNAGCPQPTGSGSGNMFAIHCPPQSRPMTIDGAELLTRSLGNAFTLKVELYLQAGAGPAPAPVQVGYVTIGPTAQWWVARFNSPFTIPANTDYYIAFQDARMAMPICASGGTNNPHFWRSSSTGSWQGPFHTQPWTLKVRCPGPNAVPSLTASGTPRIGASYAVHLSAARAFTATTLFVGATASHWGTVPLPFDLTPLGAPGCLVFAPGDVQLGYITSPWGTASQPVAVPFQYRFIGANLFHQWVVLDPVNPLGLVLSNAGRAVIGE